MIFLPVNSVKECMDMKLEGKDEGRFEVADEFAEERYWIFD
jgi:hypothetical protein